MRSSYLLATAIAAVGLLPLAARAVTPLDTTQPSLGLTFSVQAVGTFTNIGTIEMFAGNFPLNAAARGNIVLISQYPELFNQLGTTYGGDGVTTFVLPSFSGRTGIGTGNGPGLIPRALGDTVGATQVTLGLGQMPVSVGGGGQSFNTIQPSLPVEYIIATLGIFPSRGGGGGGGTPVEPMLGQVFPTVASQLPNGYLPCDGRLLVISQNTALFAILGTTYGGDGVSTFALPDLRGRAVVGADQGPGLTPRDGGQFFGSETTTLVPANLPVAPGTDTPFNNMQPSLVLHYIISLSGIFPTRDNPNVSGNFDDYLGTVSLFAGDFAPSGWAFCDGQLLSIQQNIALFAILGTQYGGDGQTNFALPDLRGRVAVGTDGGFWQPGTKFGTETLQLTPSQIPALPTLPEPASLSLLAVGVAGLLMRRRRA